MGDQKTSRVELLFVTFNKIKPYLAMVSLQFGYAGMYIVTMLCLKRGMSHYVLVVYRHAAATIAVAPFALYFERKIRPKMTISTFLKILVLAFLEPVFDQNLYYVGLKYTSATFASAIVNILPAITFIMAVLFRLEKVKIKNIRCIAKIIGTVITLGGAMLMTLYKGPVMNLFGSRAGQGHHETSSAGETNKNWVVGTLMVIASCVGWSGFFILQSFTLKAYPAELSLTSLICLMGMIEGAAVALVMERHPAAWALGWDSRILAPVYSGLICSAIAYYLQGVVIKERGPVFVTAFNPLCMIIVAVLAFLILAEQIHLGSIIGAIIIVIGLYSVIWGKSKDYKASSSTLTREKGEDLELPISTTNGNKITTTATVIDDIDPLGGMSKSEIPMKVPTSHK
ncbi:Drug/metabolite transporter [Macleaya cordata]|uniref:WAT1-related protein n=1 Tax=Macleaya cordata TaxID=56857 RepID=A0A200QJ15_MACCD|nr:Drug/metabolite transporter [Macleaya cordata]